MSEGRYQRVSWADLCEADCLFRGCRSFRNLMGTEDPSLERECHRLLGVPWAPGPLGGHGPPGTRWDGGTKPIRGAPSTGAGLRWLE